MYAVLKRAGPNSRKDPCAKTTGPGASNTMAPYDGGDGGAADPAAGPEAYDLTNTISEYLDLHLMFPLLDFVEMSHIYDGKDVGQARLELLEPTNMVGLRSFERFSVQYKPYGVHKPPGLLFIELAFNSLYCRLTMPWRSTRRCTTKPLRKRWQSTETVCLHA